MSWHYLPEVAADYTVACCSDTLPFALLKYCPTTKRSCCSDSATECFLDSPCGTTCERSTVTRGADTLTSSAEASLARTSAQPEKALESTESAADCGEKWRGSFAKYNPATSLWKTAQCSLLADSDEFSETWPQWGLMLNGVAYQQQIPALTISANESGFLPTPDNETFFYTPNTKGLDGGSNSRAALAKRQQMWPTPTVCGNYNRKGASKSSGDGLATVVARFPTPQASDNRDRGNLSTPAIQRRMEKGKQINLSMSVSTESGRLNPEWVEWLMGWPIGATALSPLGTARFQEWFQQHGAS